MSYIGNEPIVSATRTITEVTATAGQTVFTANGGYTVGYIDVFLNGAQLQTVDFTATNGTTITLTEAAQVGDVIRLVAWGTFSTATHVPLTGDSNITGNINVSGNLGVGTTSPSHKLHVIGSSSLLQNTGSVSQFISSSNGGATRLGLDSSGVIYNWIEGQSGGLIFATANTERMRIDASGRVTTPAQPAFDVRINANWNTNTAYITSWVATTNTGNHFNTTTGTFTAPVSGWYAFSYTTGGSGGVVQDLHVNGTGKRRLEWASAAGWLWATMSCAIYLNANDAVRIWHQSGQVYASPTENGFSGYLLG